VTTAALATDRRLLWLRGTQIGPLRPAAWLYWGGRHTLRPSVFRSQSARIIAEELGLSCEELMIVD